MQGLKGELEWIYKDIKRVWYVCIMEGKKSPTALCLLY